MSKWDKVFEANPDAEEIYVVDGMPFLEKKHAKNHSFTEKSKSGVETVKRVDKAAADKAAADKAAADKAAADKKAAGKKAAGKKGK